MLTIALALSSALAFALGDLSAQRLTRAHAPVATAFAWIVATGVAVTVPVAVLTESHRGGHVWIGLAYAAVAGALYLIAYSSLLRGLRVGDLSLVTPIVALQGAVAAAIAIALGERLFPLTAVGLALAVVGGALAAAGGRPAEGRRTSAGVGWALIAALAFGVSFIIYSRASAISPVTAVAASRFVTLLLILPFAARAGLSLPSRLRLTAVVVGLLEAGGLLMIVWALARGPVAVASVLGAQFATFALVLGLVVLRERPARWQLAGVLCTIAAVTALALAK